MSYNPNIPAPTDLLSDSQGDIQQNFLSANTSFGINHFPFDDLTVNNGKHKFVDMPVRALGSVTTLAGEGALYTSTNGGISKLVYARDNNIANDVFLTGPILGATNGYTTIQGGILIQWGRVASTTSGTVTFATANIAFTTACWVVFANPYFTGANPNGAAGIAINQSTLSSTKFDWVFNSNSGAYAGFHWVAIGR